MARIIVTPDPVDREREILTRNGAVLLDESVYPLHLRDQHFAGQLVERLAWAVSDAERSEREHAIR